MTIPLPAAHCRIRRRGVPLHVAALLLVVAIAGCDSTDPVRPDPEIVPTDTTAVVLEWLRANAKPIARLENTADHADLAPFGAMVGTASVVGLGESTHGTREFTQLKTRFFRHLVEQHGFRAFTIEATMPEGFMLDDYVRNGNGDALTAVRRLYFWTIGGLDLVEMVEWLRSYNLQRPPEERVGFYGVDIQFPGAAIDSVISYTRRVGGAELGATIADLYACAQPYRNDERGAFPAYLADAPAAERDACIPRIAQAHAMVRDARQSLVAASTVREYERTLQMARVVVQWSGLEQYAAAGDLRVYDHRDQAMAENVIWARNQHGPGARVVVSGHNGHVSMRPVRETPFGPGTMGYYLRQQLGAAGYVALGFAFDSGSALSRAGVEAGVTEFNLPPAGANIDAYEHLLRRVEGDYYYFDARAATPGSIPAAWLRGPHRLRTIGALYEPEYWQEYFGPSQLGVYWDIITFVRRSTPTRMLPR